MEQVLPRVHGYDTLRMRRCWSRYRKYVVWRRHGGRLRKPPVAAAAAVGHNVELWIAMPGCCVCELRLLLMANRGSLQQAPSWMACLFNCFYLVLMAA